jgi:hypothetical protein
MFVHYQLHGNVANIRFEDKSSEMSDPATDDEQ